MIFFVLAFPYLVVSMCKCSSVTMLFSLSGSKGKGKAKEAKKEKGYVEEATKVGNRRIGGVKRRIGKKKKKSKSDKAKESQSKRRLVRGIVPKYCVLCVYWSEGNDDVTGRPPLCWGHPRHDRGVEGSECYYCRRVHRAKASFISQCVRV